MLHEFILANRDVIIERTKQRVRERVKTEASDTRLEFGVPLFLTQLVETLAQAEARLTPLQASSTSTAINDSASLHGTELLKNGFTIAQVVHGYGDVCQIVTELAVDSGAAISPEEFHVFNLCLDDAIAGAVTTFGKQREQNVAYEGTERLGVLAHEVRNLLNTAVLSFDAIRRGAVGVGGSTGAIHARSLANLRSLVDRSLAEVQLSAGSAKLERVSLLEFFEDIELGAVMEADSRGIALTIEPIESDAAIDADRQLLTSAVSNLLQNAFKYSRPHGSVLLRTRLTAEQVLIEVHDECGGLPAGKERELFLPFQRGSSKKPGLGLGLGIAQRAVQANRGSLEVRSVPGKGCIFTIELPRQELAPAGV